ncbi:MAG: hypothetical protein WCF90_00170 [Methanomicrobiales archaeon]
MRENGVAVPKELEERISGFERDDKAAVIVAVGSQMGGEIAIADTLKETSRDAITEFKKMGVRIVMTTGNTSGPLVQSPAILVSTG